MSKKYKNLQKIYEENKNKINMPKLINYPLNYKNGMIWASSQCDDESKDFAKLIIEKTKYVSYDEFVEGLKTICDSLINKHDKNKVYVIIIPGKVSKSNTWVSLLSMQFVKKIASMVYSNITDVYNDIHKVGSELYKKRVECLVFDDCAYTGHQMFNNIMLDNIKIIYKNKPKEPSQNSKEWLNWNENVSSDISKLVKEIDINYFSVSLIIPYMSRKAKERLSRIPYTKLSYNTQILPTFKELIDTTKIPIPIMNEFRKTFQYHKDLIPIYFDHKIADSLSTFHKIYLLAPLFNCVVRNKSIKFIDGCEDLELPENINPYDFYMDIESVLGKKTCPKTFYKDIRYTFGSKILSNDCEFVDLL